MINYFNKKIIKIIFIFLSTLLKYCFINVVIKIKIFSYLFLINYY